MPLPSIASRSAAVRQHLQREEHIHKHRPRLVFALDATASRQPAWDLSSKLQAEMFAEAGAAGLDLQLVYYRGDECKASRWVSNGAELKGLMHELRCKAGRTQIGKVLAHTLRESDKTPIKALVFIGDCFEENIGDMVETASALGAKGVRAFMFHEDGDTNPPARKAFQKIAELTGGIYAPFDANSAAELSRLLRAAAAYAAGKPAALVELRKVAGLLAAK
jgi:hypothetical protein